MVQACGACLWVAYLLRWHGRVSIHSGWIGHFGVHGSVGLRISLVSRRLLHWLLVYSGSMPIVWLVAHVAREAVVTYMLRVVWLLRDASRMLSWNLPWLRLRNLLLGRRVLT